MEDLMLTPQQKYPRRFTLCEAVLTARRTRVLVADDDPDVRRLLSLKLSKDGCDVVELEDGAHLHDYLASMILGLSSDRPDIIVSDICMPGFSGLEVLEDLRRAKWTRPVVLMSAFDDEVARMRAKQLGAKAVFHKPFDTDRLRALILDLSSGY